MRFEDGAAVDVATVIWATGFGIDHSWIDVPVFDADGRIVHRRGVTASRGLYFLGLPWLHTRGSALLGWVKDDAQYIAEQIARNTTDHARDPHPPPSRSRPSDVQPDVLREGVGPATDHPVRPNGLRVR